MNSCQPESEQPAFRGESSFPMLEAVRLARLSRFKTAPNPCVGAVLTRDGRIAAKGRHLKCGLPHAEVEALSQARSKNLDTSACTLWVTLEPCNHTGKTPPCTRAILEAGIKRVVIGTLDPNPDVAGGGAEFLRSRGVEVEIGVEERACRDLISDFILWKNKGRTFNILKLAATLDGRIATRTGHSKWVSSPESRRRVHELRGSVQAVIVGGGTFYADNPALTRRLGPDGGADADPNGPDQPLAVVLTSRLPDPKGDHYLLRERPGRTMFWTGSETAESEKAKRLEDLGVRVLGLPPKGEGLDLEAGFRFLYEKMGFYYVLCEGGGGLGMSLLSLGLADEFQLFTAPKVIGDNRAAPVFNGRVVERMDQALQLRAASVEMSGEDVLTVLRPLGE